MSVAALSLNPDLKRLVDEGYELEVRDGCAIVWSVPYLDSSKTVQRGVLVSPLKMSGDTVAYDGIHTIFFQGSLPHHYSGSSMNSVYHSAQNRTLAGIHVDMMFSNKPCSGFRDYHHKFTHYIHLLSAEAQAVDPSATAATFKRIIASADSVFNYADTNASRSAITDVTDKLKGQTIGIVGLGGTGSYLLDQLAKTPVAEIHLFDGDVFCQHNAFRAPGAPSVDVFEAQPYKTDYFRDVYSKMHRHIFSHPYNLDEGNVSELAKMDFVFICMDSGEPKRIIVDFLKHQHIGFVDTGIDVYRAGGSLIGMTRATISVNGNTQAADRHISFEPADRGLYQSNVQTAELNALCALTAILQWKLALGFYTDNFHLNNGIFTTNDGEFKWD